MGTKIATKTVTTVQKTHTIKLTGADIIELMEENGHEISKEGNIKVTFTVPGGADWSGMEIEIDNDYPIEVEWTEGSTEVEEC